MSEQYIYVNRRAWELKVNEIKKFLGSEALSTLVDIIF